MWAVDPEPGAVHRAGIRSRFGSLFAYVPTPYIKPKTYNKNKKGKKKKFKSCELDQFETFLKMEVVAERMNALEVE